MSLRDHQTPSMDFMKALAVSQQRRSAGVIDVATPALESPTMVRVRMLEVGVCGTDAELCAACLAKPPRIKRSRSVVIYNEITRELVLRLKYGRKVGVAKTLAHYMAPLLAHVPADAAIVPVPLHRRRLWQRGFNQAGLLARELSRRTGLSIDQSLIRTKRTPPLQGMSRLQRRKTVAGAFGVRPGTNFQGRTIVLVDDVLTTGSTANGCARALLKAGAERVEFVSWARVARPTQLDA